MSKNKYKYIILGGGLSGLSTAFTLSEKFKGEVLIIEKNKELGGLSRFIISENGDKLDIGSHRLQKSYIKNILNFISKSLEINLNKIPRLSKIYINKNFINYPIKSIELFKNINFFKSFLSLIESFYYKIFYRKGESFEKKAKCRVGNYIYKNFYENYAKKTRRIKLNELSKTVLKKRFNLNPLKIIKEGFQKRKIYFLYPKGGFGNIVNNFLKKLSKNRVDFILGQSDYKIYQDKKYLEISGEKIYYDKLISTIPIQDLSNYLGLKQDLSHKGLYILYIYFDKEPLLSGETFYFPDFYLPFGRVSIPKRFDRNLQNNKNYTIYTVEIPLDFLEKESEKLFYRAIKGLEKVGLIDENYIFDKEKSFFVYEENVYPLYKIGWEKSLKNILEEIVYKYKDIFVSGRQGLFLHCNIDHTMKIGFELGEFLLQGKQNNEWLDNIGKYNNFIVRD